MLTMLAPLKFISYMQPWTDVKLWNTLPFLKLNFPLNLIKFIVNKRLDTVYWILGPSDTLALATPVVFGLIAS